MKLVKLMVLCAIVFTETKKKKKIMIRYLHQCVSKIMRISKIIGVNCFEKFKCHSHIKSKHNLKLQTSQRI